MPAEIIINASGVSPEVAIWLKKSSADGHFYIERKPLRYGSSSDYFRVTEKEALRLQTLDISEAWREMERMVGVAPC